MKTVVVVFLFAMVLNCSPLSESSSSSSDTSAETAAETGGDSSGSDSSSAIISPTDASEDVSSVDSTDSTSSSDSLNTSSSDDSEDGSATITDDSGSDSDSSGESGIDSSGSDSSISSSDSSGSSSSSGSDSSGSDTSGGTTGDSAPTPSPVSIGFWGLNGFISDSGLADVVNRFGSTIFQVSSTGPNYTASTLLPMVSGADLKVTLNMTGYSYLTHTNFNLSEWETALSNWSTGISVANQTALAGYIADGTLAGHMILDDISNFSYVNGGTDPTAQDLEDMACFSDTIFGDQLMTFVRERCDEVPVLSGGYHCLDACVNQYTNYPGYSDGDVSTYATTVAAAAAARNLRVINGLNIVDGGDGRSGQIGSVAGHYAMSADEIAEYGVVLLDRSVFPDLQIFLMWEYDSNQTVWQDGTYGSVYFDQTSLQSALFDLSTLAGNSAL